MSRNKVSITIGGKTLSIQQRALINGGVFFNRMFEEEGGSISSEEVLFIEYISDAISLLETGYLSPELLDLNRDILQQILDYFDLPFYNQVIDYPDDVLFEAYYNQWYSLRRHQKEYSRYWKNNCRLTKITDEDIENIKIGYDMRLVGSRPVKMGKGAKWNSVPIINSRRYVQHKINKQFGEYSSNVLSRFDRGYDNSTLIRKGLDLSKTKEALTANIFATVFDDLKRSEDIKRTIKKLLNVFPDHKDEISLLSKKEGAYERVLEFVMNWFFDGSTVVAGGSIVNILSNGYNRDDIDIFFINCTEEHAMAKIKTISLLVDKDSRWIRTKQSISVGKRVQFILRIYSDIEELLMGLDIDASSFAYDGKDILTTPLGIQSLINRVVIVFLSRQSDSTTYRVCKYAEHKHFSVYIPLLSQYNNKGASILYPSEGFTGIYYWYLYGSIPKVASDYQPTIKKIENNKDKGPPAKTITVDNHSSGKKLSITQLSSSKRLLSAKLGNKTVQRYIDNVIISTTFDDVILLIDTIEKSFPVVWKKINPGEQNTGSFFVKVYKDHRQWYYNKSEKQQKVVNENEIMVQVALTKGLSYVNMEKIDKDVLSLVKMFPKRKGMLDKEKIHDPVTKIEKSAKYSDETITLLRRFKYTLLSSKSRNNEDDSYSESEDENNDGNNNEDNTDSESESDN